MNIDSDNTLRGNTNVAGRDIGFSEDFKLGGKEWEPRIDGMFRISNRQRLLFNYFKYDKDRRETLGGTSPSVTSACRPAASSRAS